MADASLWSHRMVSSCPPSRVLRLTLLAPEMVEAILDGTQGPEMSMAKLREPFPVGGRPRASTKVSRSNWSMLLEANSELSWTE